MKTILNLTPEQQLKVDHWYTSEVVCLCGRLLKWDASKGIVSEPKSSWSKEEGNLIIRFLCKDCHESITE